MEEKKIAICAKQITKIYKLYDRPSDRMKEALGLSRKKLYKEHYALKGVDMSIYQGETVGIIGTNGSGKSTILKIITGVTNPTEGKLEIDGRIYRQEKENGTQESYQYQRTDRAQIYYDRRDHATVDTAKL